MPAPGDRHITEPGLILDRVRRIWLHRHFPGNQWADNMLRFDPGDPLPDEVGEAEAQEWAEAILAGHATFAEYRAKVDAEVVGGVERSVSNVEEAAHRVHRAIVDEGPVPPYHNRVMEKHRKEWPTLWAALDELIAELDRTGRSVD